MTKFGIKLLFITFLEVIFTIICSEFLYQSASPIQNINFIIKIILVIEFCISIYFIYNGIKNKNEVS